MAEVKKLNLCVGCTGVVEVYKHRDEINISVYEAYRESDSHQVAMDLDKARELRDWLNEVLD